jgi:hypothetical protein
MAKQFSNMEDLEQHLRTVYQPFGELTDEQWRHMTEHSAMRNSEGYYRQNFDPAIVACVGKSAMPGVDPARRDV